MDIRRAQQYYNYTSQGIGPTTMQSPYHLDYMYRDKYQTQPMSNPRSPQHYLQHPYNSPFYPVMSNEGGKDKAQQPKGDSLPSDGGSPSKDGPQFFCFYEPCATIGKSFGRKADLERHIIAIHTRASAPTVDCEYLGCHRRGEYGFVRRDKMIEHMRDVHKSDIPKRQPGKRSP